MNGNDTPFQPDAALDDEAAAWLCEAAEGFTPARAAEFAAWRARDPRHAAAVLRVEQALALLDEMPAVRDRIEARVAGRAAPAARAAEVTRGPFGFTWAAGLAAMIAVVLSIGWLAMRERPGHHATTAATQQRVTLPDGSIVDLNTASQIKVDLRRHERRVTLDRGEAHFQVASDPARPFIVQAGGLTVRAVGTAFNVRLEEAAVDVLVVEGKVEVTPEDSPTPTAAVAAPAKAALPVLGAGQRVVVQRERRDETPVVQQVSPASMQSLLAWQGAMTTFLDVPLRQIVEEFNRRNATQLVLADAALGERRVGGVMPLDKVADFVRLLEREGDIVAERSGTGHIVLRAAR